MWNFGSQSADGTTVVAVGSKTQCYTIFVASDVVNSTRPFVVANSSTVYYNSSRAEGPSWQCTKKSISECTKPCFWDKDAGRCTSFVKQRNLLHWPSPLEENTSAYTLVDYPRFFVPPWGPSPMPASETKLREFNGYDFGNNVDGDTYVFVLGTTLTDYHASRADFVALTGGSPVLPDFAWGTWFTWWHQYKQSDAEAEVDRWSLDNLPIDVWALDMNWRNTSGYVGA